MKILLVKAEDGKILIPFNDVDVVIINEEDYPKIKNYSWFIKRNNNKKPYVKTNVKIANVLKSLSMHRIILGIEGKSSNILVDHIDGNGLNNCRNNLRIVDSLRNSWNTRNKRCSKSEYIGVYQFGKYWRSDTSYKENSIYLGKYKLKDHAALAYNIAVEFIRGPYNGMVNNVNIHKSSEEYKSVEIKILNKLNRYVKDGKLVTYSMLPVATYL